MLPAVPRPLVQKLAGRYIAGPELKDARETVRHLNSGGKLATIDVLGEEITNEDETYEIARAYEDDELLAHARAAGFGAAEVRRPDEGAQLLVASP